jgi:DNA polymerase sigma
VSVEHVCGTLCQCCRQKKLSIRKMTMIRTARIPLIKLETNSRVVADISLGDASGPRAANYVAQQVGGVGCLV